LALLGLAEAAALAISDAALCERHSLSALGRGRALVREQFCKLSSGLVWWAIQIAAYQRAYGLGREQAVAEQSARELTGAGALERAFQALAVETRGC
jgi:hypothetical protein